MPTLLKRVANENTSTNRYQCEGQVSNSLCEVSFLSPRPTAPAEESSPLLALVFASAQWLNREEKRAFKTPGESWSHVEMWEESVMQPCQGGMPKINWGWGSVVCCSFQLLNFPPYQSKPPQFSHVWKILFCFNDSCKSLKEANAGYQCAGCSRWGTQLGV